MSSLLQSSLDSLIHLGQIYNSLKQIHGIHNVTLSMCHLYSWAFFTLWTPLYKYKDLITEETAGKLQKGLQTRHMSNMSYGDVSQSNICNIAFIALLADGHQWCIGGCVSQISLTFYHLMPGILSPLTHSNTYHICSITRAFYWPEELYISCCLHIHSSTNYCKQNN